MNIFVARYIANKTGPIHMTFEDEERAAKMDPWLVRVRDIENAYVMDASGRVIPAGHLQTCVFSSGKCE